MKTTRKTVTILLLAWREGDSSAFDRLMPLVYGNLRKQADNYLKRERPGHTLQPTALVNEAYLRLVDQAKVDWRTRGQFYAIAARAMRRILVDHARKRMAAKRGGDRILVQLDPELHLATRLPLNHQDLMAMDDALCVLAAIAPRQSEVVELRFFGGLSIEQTARCLDMSVATIKTDWKMARAWLYRELRPSKRGLGTHDGR